MEVVADTNKVLVAIITSDRVMASGASVDGVIEDLRKRYNVIRLRY